MPTKREGELKSLFGRELKLRLPNFLILQYATNGAPDREIVGYGRTSRWEAKHGTPDFKSPGDQELMCCRLAVVAHCRYIIWQEHHGILRTIIAHPRAVMDRVGWNIVPETWCDGFNMKWLVEQVRREHEPS